jgi:arylsulfatase A-like enzyme
MRGASSPLWVVVLLAGPVGSPAPISAQQPDIILIQTDDQPWHTLPQMPNVQRLIGDQGVRFDGYYINTSLCAPSRVTTLLGQYSHHTGILGNAKSAKMFLPKSPKSLPVWLQNAGYRTALVGKWLNDYSKAGSGWPAAPAGWSVWRAMKGPAYYNYQLSIDGVIEVHGSTPAEYSTRVLRDYAVQVLNSAPIDTPLFLLFTPYAPHAPMIPDPADVNAFNSVPWGISFLPNYNEVNVSDKPAWVRALPLVKDKKMQKQYENQLESLQAVDRAVADILAAAEARGRPLYVFYISDNGWTMGAHRWFRKWCAYDECSKGPFLVRGPGIPAGVVIDNAKLVSNVDLAPTIAALAGATANTTVDGLNLLPLLQEPTLEWKRDVLLEDRGSPSAKLMRFWSIRSHDGWEWTEYDNGDRELYDMTTDAFQLESRHKDAALADLRADLAARLAALRE